MLNFYRCLYIIFFTVKKIIDSLPNIQAKKIWVQGVVVFANKDAVLRKEIIPDNIEVKSLNELSDYVKSYFDKELLSLTPLQH